MGEMLTYASFGINGRLGNQMFQLAVIHAAAKRLNTKYFLPLRLEGNSNYSTCQDLWEFNTSKLNELEWIEPKDYVAKCGKEQINPRTYEEPFFHYDPNFVNLPNNTNIKGFFQSEKYFSEYREELLKAFTLKEPSETYEKFYESIFQKENSLSIHVRRGDAVGKEWFHGDVGIGSYYRDAITVIEEASKEIPIDLVVFSDDIPYCKEWLKTIGKTFNTVEFVSGTSGAEDIMLQSKCSRNIIANSSFSWWGAWLNLNPHKIVVAPKTWFGEHGPKDIQDIYASGWITR